MFLVQYIQKKAYCSSFHKVTTITDVLKKSQYNPSFKLHAFLMSCAEGNFEICNRLLNDKEVDPTAFNNEGFRVACCNGKEEIVSLLLQDPRIDPTDGNTYFEKNEGFRMAVLNNHFGVVKLLLQDGRADPTADNNFPIRIASMKGHQEIVELLLQHKKVNPAARSLYLPNEALRLASQYGHSNIVKTLLDLPSVNPFLKSEQKRQKVELRELMQSLSVALALAKDRNHNDTVAAFTSLVPENQLPPPIREKHGDFSIL